MAKVKLDLQGKNDEELRLFADGHQTAMNTNANFPTPVPTPAVFGAALGSYSGKLDEIATMEVQLKTKRAQKDTLRELLEAELTGRGVYVDQASGGDEAKILSAGFPVQAAATPTTSLAAPDGVVATMGDHEGEIDVAWHGDRKSRSFIIEQREHSDTAAPGPWAQVKISTRSSCAVNGLISGKKYAFRIRALGPNELESPWSAEAICMAP